MMNVITVVLLVLFGVALLVAELFLLPGFGIAGISGFLSLGGAVAVAYLWLTPVYPWAGHVTLAACIVLTFLAIYLFLRGKTIEKMALETTIDSSVSLAEPGKKIEKLEEKARQMEEKEEQEEKETNNK